MNAEETPATTNFTHSLAVVIGIDAYGPGIARLTTAVNDATRLAELLRAKHGYQTILLTEPSIGQKVTRGSLQQLFAGELLARLGEDDRLLVYFAGHGVALDGDDGPRGYLVPQDARPGDSASMLPMTDLHKWLTDLPCRHMLAILDCCFAGAFRWSATRHIGALPDVIHKERYDRYLASPAWHVLTSAAYDQTALDVLNGKAIGVRESDGKRHSPFAEALIAALEKGEADLVPKGQGDGVITATELYLYLREQVEVQAEAEASHEQSPGLWPLNKHRKGEFIFLAPGHPLNLPPAPDLTAELNPYRGLKSYDQKHSQLFFGREDEITELVQMVDAHPFLAVLGASGTGKSSLVKAGVLPRLAGVRGREPGDASQGTDGLYRVLPPMRPTDRPLQALAALLHAELGENLIGLALAETVARWAAAHPGQRLVLTIDQFEELATLCRDEDQRERFLVLLATAVKEQPDAFRLIITLRTDFEPQFTTLDATSTSALASAWQSARYIVPPMDIEDLRQVIEGPASVRVLYFDLPGLVDDLIKEVIQTPGALPLLSFTLSELYVKYVQSGREDRALSGADYQALGGVVGSLRNRAAEEYDRLPDDAHRATMQRVMLRMVAVEGGELARRRVALNELAYPTEGENTRVKAVLNRLVDARLLVRDSANLGADGNPDPYVEPAHDALVMAWDKLLRWKRDAEEYLPLQRRLAQAATEWRKATPEAKSGLLWDDDPRLPQVEETLWPTGGKQKGLRGRVRWAQQVLAPKTAAPKDTKWLNGPELTFTQASVSRRAGTLRRIIGITTAVMIVLAGLALFANTQRLAAVDQARRAKVGELTARSKASLTTDPELGVLLARSALATAEPETGYAFEAADALRVALLESRIETRINHGVKALWAGAFSADRMQFAVAGQDGKILVFDTFSGALISTFDTGGKTCITDLTFDPEPPRRLGVTGYRYDRSCLDGAIGGFVQIWDMSSGERIFANEFSESANDLDFNPNSSTLVVQTGNSRVHLWDVETKTEIASQHIQKWININRPTFSADGAKLGMIVSDHTNARNESIFDTIALWDSDLEHELTSWRVTQGDEHIWGLAFGPKGEVAVTDDQGNVSIWDMTDIHSPRLSNRQGVHNGVVFDVVFSSNGACVATAGRSDHTATVLVGANAQPMVLLGHKDAVLALAFLKANSVVPADPLAPCGTDSLATISSDGMVMTWNIGPSREYKALHVHAQPIEEIEFSPDGKYLVTASDDGKAQLWNVEPFYRLGVLDDGEHIWDLDFSPDGQTIVTASKDGTVKVWQTSSLTLKLPPIKGHDGSANAVSFRPPQGKQFASGGSDGRVLLWDSQTGAPIHEGEWHLSPFGVNSIEFDSDGAQMIIGFVDGSSRIINLASGDVTTLSVSASDQVYHAIFGPGGHYVVTASEDGAIRSWDITPGKSLYQRDLDDHFIGSHQGSAYRLDLDSTGQLLASAGADGKIIMWDVATGKRVGTISASNVSVNSVKFSPNGRLLAAADDNGIVRIYLVNSNDLVKFATLRATRRFTDDECQQYDIPDECQ